MIDKAGSLFNIRGVDAIPLTKKSVPDLQKLFERCPDYFNITEGRAAKKDAGEKKFHDVPAGYAKQNLLCLGLRRVGGVLVGVIIAYPNYPRTGQWYVSLFLLDPGWRGLGMGRDIFLAFEAWAKTRNATALLLSVVAPNERGAKFWESIGFILPRCYKPARIGMKRQILIEYEKPLKALEEGAWGPVSSNELIGRVWNKEGQGSALDPLGPEAPDPHQ